MAVRSVIDIDVDDAKFKAFQTLFAKYQTALATTPGTWAQVNQQVSAGASGFQAMTAAIAAQTQILSNLVAQQKTVAQQAQSSAGYWQSIARSTQAWAKNVEKGAQHVEGVLKSLFRYGAIAGGLAGIGGFLGDRLVGDVASNRQSALGRGLTYGEQSAFRVNFSRFVEPDSFLSAVANAKLDVQKRVGLLGAGLSESEINGDTGQTSVALLRNLRRIAQTSDPKLYGQVIQGLRLGDTATPQLLNLLRGTSNQEFGQLLNNYSTDKSTLNLPPEAQRAWQDFSTQMSRAGTSIENTLVKGLTPLEPKLVKLSEAFEKLVEAFLRSDTIKNGIDTLANIMDRLSGNNSKSASPGEAAAAGAAIGGLVGLPLGVPWLGAIIGGGIGYGVGGGGSHPLSGARGAGGFLDSFNNPGNLRPPGASTGFQHFGTADEGVKAMARQIAIYAQRDKLDTLAGIIGKYAPPGENDTEAYVRDVSKKTGYGGGQHLNLSDSQTMAKVVAAMISHEQARGHFDRYKDTKVVVEVLNNTGGNATVNIKSVAGGGT